MEDVFGKKLRKLSHEFHKLWLVLEVTDEFVFLLNFEVLVLQDDLLQTFLGYGLTSIGQIIEGLVVEALGQINEFLDCCLQVFDRSVPYGEGVVGLVALVEAAVEWAIIEF